MQTGWIGETKDLLIETLYREAWDGTTIIPNVGKCAVWK